MKKITKVIKAFLCLALVLALIAGCGGNPAVSGTTQGETTTAQTTAAQSSATESSTAESSAAAGGAAADETVALRMFCIGDRGSDVKMVSDAVSEYTIDKINVSVELVFYGWSDYTSTIPRLLAADEVMDVGFDAGWMDYVNRSRAGAYYDITDELDTVPELYTTVGDVMWNGSKVDGRIYGVPTKKEYATQWAVLVEEEFIKNNNVDISGIKNLKDCEVILEALHQDPERAGFMINLSRSNAVMLHNLENYFYGSSFDPSYVSVMRIGEEGTFINYYETPEFKEHCEMLFDWYKKGYIDQSVATIENYDKYTIDSHNWGMSTIGYSPLTDVAQSMVYGKTIIPITITPIMLRDLGVVGSINCIYNKSKNHEKSLEFLQLLNTDPIVKNLVTYGIEGVHYDLIDGKARTVPNLTEKYNASNWTTGNMYISYLVDGDADNKYDLYDQFNADALISPMVGFQPITDSIDDKIAALNGVCAEYVPLLMMGALDPDEYIPTLVDALRAAGSDDVIAEMQRQYDEFAG